MDGFTTDPVALTRMLCNIESVSGNEKDIADAIERILATHAPHLHITRDGDAIVARTELGRAERVILAGHIDTVPLNQNLPVENRRDPVTGEPVLWGRGTVDMKGGAAIHLSLAVELTHPSVDLTWVWYDHEEVSDAMNGLGRLIRHHPGLFDADVAILGEPSSAIIEGGCNGTLTARVTYLGERAHSARPWMGLNAIHRSADALSRISAYETRSTLVEGLEYQESFNAVMIDAGVAHNVIPDRCDIVVNYRFAPSVSGEEAATFVRGFFHDADRVDILDTMVGATPGLDGSLLSTLLEHVGEEPQAKLGWTDVARFSALGIPAVNYGPGVAALSHTDDEQVPVSHIHKVHNSLKQWLTSQ